MARTLSTPPVLNPAQQNTAARKLAAEHGFGLSGLALIPADGRAPRAAAFEKWLEAGLHGPLDYMRRNARARAEIRSRFPWARSVLALGTFYAAADAKTPALPAHVARYAHGRDYHLLFERRLKKLGRALQAAGVCAQAHWYVDTGPVLERAWAEAAGLGWIGKNACLIHPRLGSFLLLAEIVMDSTPQPDAPAPDHCGTCRRCLDACPTGALTAPGVLDAARCLATWNIERRGATPEEFWAKQSGWVFGCDACQTACPYNRPKDAPGPDAELAAPLEWHGLTLTDCIGLSETRFAAAFAGSPLRRSGLKGLRLGAITAAGNGRAATCRPALEACLADPDAEIRARAKWALLER